jgi:hypothetical protein
VARPRRSSGQRKSLHEEDARKKNVIGSAIIIVVLAAAGTLFYFYQTAARDDVVLETGCPVGGAISLTTVIIDGSDRITQRPQAFLRNHIEAIKQDIPRGGALEVYRLGKDPDRLLDPIVSVCNPGRGSDVDPLTKSRKRAEKVWQDTFQSKLQDVFDRLLNVPEESSSPIFESIQSVSISSFASPQWRNKPKRLVLVSDMLQFTKEFSHYETPGNFEKFRGTSYYHKVRTDLSEVEVTVFYVSRDTRKKTQGEGHRDFWKAYFLDQGARPGKPAMFVQVEG